MPALQHITHRVRNRCAPRLILRAFESILNRMMHYRQLFSLVLMLLSLAAGCTSAPTPSVTPTSSFTPTFTPSPTWTLTPTATFTPSATPTATPTPSATPTPTRTFTPSPTFEPPTLVPSPTGRPPTATSGAASGAGAAPANATPRPTQPPPVQPHTPRGANLLANGGFEGGMYQQGAPEVVVPDGWTAWWYEGQTAHDHRNPIGYVRPEMKVIPKEPPFLDPPRIYEGNRAVMFFGSYKVVDAGYWQQVPVEQGRRVHLSGWGHAWSTTGGDPFHSELNTADDRINAQLQLGIDPTGGTSAQGPNVVWGAVTFNYDEYGPVAPVQTTARSGTITVFVRGKALWPFQHNDFYFDAIHLEYVP